MSKKIFFTIAIIGVFSSFNFAIKKENPLTIFHKGIGDIQVGISSLNQVKKEYGETEIQKKWHKAKEVECIGRYEYFIRYDSIATFSTITNHRNKSIVYKIVLNSDSKCRTSSGNGIGSSYKKIIKEFGKPNTFYYFNDNGVAKTKVSYNNMDIILNGNDTFTNIVNEIIIW